VTEFSKCTGSSDSISLSLSAPRKRRITYLLLAVPRIYVRSKMLMLFKYLKRPNTNLERKWHLIIHGCQIFTFIIQGIRGGTSSLLLNLIQGSKETNLNCICSYFTLKEKNSFNFVMGFEKRKLIYSKLANGVSVCHFVFVFGNIFKNF